MQESKHQHRALILVTGPDRGGWPAWFFTKISVWLAGGRAKRMTPHRYARVKNCPFDGLILGGGADVDPARYGAGLLHDMQELHRGPHPQERYVILSVFSLLVYALRSIFSLPSHGGFLDKERDAMEWSLLDQAIRDGRPVLGICRGSQLINVYFRGTLHQDIRPFYTEYPQYRSIFPKKIVHVKRASQLFRILHRERCLVNALHNQSVAELADELEVAACEPNGIIQAIECKQKSRPVLGVQWHPEYLVQKTEQRLLFQWLVARAERRAVTDTPVVKRYAW
jgi:putative glutamine amidotransferase